MGRPKKTKCVYRILHYSSDRSVATLYGHVQQQGRRRYSLFKGDR
jgi:hypothetical protein